VNEQQSYAYKKRMHQQGYEKPAYHPPSYLESTPVKTNFCARSFSVRRRLSKVNTLKKSDVSVYAIICI
jgi:phage terminase small subunit